MLSKENLLTILRSCSVFQDTDSGKRIKAVCRYQQFRAAMKIVDKSAMVCLAKNGAG